MSNNLKTAIITQFVLLILVSFVCSTSQRPCTETININRPYPAGNPFPLKRNICYHINISNASTVYYTCKADKDFTIYISRYHSGQGYIQMHYSGKDKSFQEQAGGIRSGFIFSYFSDLNYECSAYKQKGSYYFSIRKHGSGNQKYILSIQ